MRRMRAAAAIAVPLAAGAFAVGAAAAPQPKSTGGSIYTTFFGGDAHAEFNAMLDRRGAAKGQVHVRITGIEGVADFHGDVTCLNVTGNEARFSGPISKGSAIDPNTGNPARSFVFVVQDNGEPGRGADMITIERNEAAATATSCQTAQTANRLLEKGNIQVRG